MIPVRCLRNPSLSLRISASLHLGSLSNPQDLQEATGSLVNARTRIDLLSKEAEGLREANAVLVSKSDELQNACDKREVSLQ